MPGKSLRLWRVAGVRWTVGMMVLPLRSVFVLLFSTVVALLPAAALEAQTPAAAGRYIVQLRFGARSAPEVLASRHGLQPVHVFRSASRGFAAVVPAAVLKQLAADRDVAAVIPDREINATARPSGGGGGGSTQIVPAGVSRIGAQPGGVSYTGLGVGVAIVDTGIDFNHADLAVASASFSAYGTSAQDDNGHGTHVAGIVAARNNTIDVVGVAPDAALYAVKVLSSTGSGYDSDIMAGLDWVAANAALLSPAIKVVNMSLGRPGTLNDNPAMRQSVQSLYQLGVTVVVAAGNDASLEVSQNVPATYPEVIAVASTAAKTGTSATTLSPIAADTASYFTTDGAMNTSGVGVAISAPGEDAENIAKGNKLSSVGILSTRLGGGTTRMSGTSMAAPHVAGVAALMYQRTSTILPYDVKVDLMTGADRAGTAPLDGRTTGYTFDGEREGVLSAPGALAVP
jgi:subtilisin